VSKGGRHPTSISEEAVLAYIREAPGPVDKRGIAKHFGLSAQRKMALKMVLKDLENDGRLEKGDTRHYNVTGGVPRVAVLKVVRITQDGEAIGEPEEWPADNGVRPRILIVERRDKRTRQKALGIGDRIMARIDTARSGRMRAHPLKSLERKVEPLLGIIRKVSDGFRLEAVDKKLRIEGLLFAEDLNGAEVGELVRADPVGSNSRFGQQRFRVAERLGSPLLPKSFSLIAVHQHGIPVGFSDEALFDARAAAQMPLGEREDLRAIPLITIDPVDARDHDDAIYASPRDDGGHDIIVAIADVSFYVRPGSMLDGDARARGNSVYFPDRVVPMLPEILSADVCSLKPGVDRACLAAHMQIDAQGELKQFRFTRAVMRSAANLAYEVAQQIADSPSPGAARHPLPQGEREIIAQLWAAWGALSKARAARQPLNLDLPEKRITLDDMGRIAEIKLREHLDAHRVVEDFMILANVAAAKQLEAKRAVVMYRAHEAPSREKLLTLKDFMETLGEKLALGQVIQAETFNQLMARTKAHEAAELIQQMILRTQSQAYYGIERLGHFGLSLGTYAHFTSPIRRYSDLLVHRALVTALGLGEGGADATDLAQLGEHISMTERRAMMAERDTMDRYVAAYMSGREGEVFTAKITSVARFGLFVTLDGIGGDGLLPISQLGAERFHFDEKALRLEGSATGTSYHLGMKLQVQLAEARVATGGLLFGLAETPESASPGLTPKPLAPNRRPFKRRGTPRRT
jgi:ribonuclease R